MLNRPLKKILIIWLFLIAAVALLGKTTIASDYGNTAADFLNIGVGARPASLGGAFTSVADDASAAYWNPGGLSNVNSPQLILSHFSWYQDMYYEYLAAAYPVRNNLTLAVNLSYLSYGTIEGYDEFDNPTGELSSTYDMAVGFSAGYKATDHLSFGLTAKYIIISLAGENASAVAADAGVRYTHGISNFGAAISNIGSQINFGNESEKLPVSARIGYSIKPFDDLLMGGLDIEKQFQGDFSIKNGYELCFESRYFIRAGYAYTFGQDGREFGQTPSFGIGAILGPAAFDYTFSFQEKYSSESIHRFSVLFAF